MEWFIQLHRKLLNWEWYKNWNVTRVFLHCLLKSNWKDKNWEWITINRGEFITSYENLSKELSWKNSKITIMQIRTSLNKLFLTGEITIKTTNRYTIIKVNNYNDYQKDNTQDNKQITNKQQTDNKQITTTNKDNKDNKEKKSVSLLKLWTLANVKIIQEQLDKLYLDYWKQVVDNKIEELSLYIPNAPKKYKDFSAVIRSWLKRDWIMPNVNENVLKMDYDWLLANARKYTTRDKWILEMRKFKDKMNEKQIEDIRKIDSILNQEALQTQKEIFYNQ